MFLKLLYIVNINSYKKEKLKLHRSFLDVKGGKQPCEQHSLQHLTVTVKINIFMLISVESTTNSRNTLRKCTQKYNNYIVHFFSKTLVGGGAKIIP